LLPALRGGAIPGSEKWFVIEMIPGSQPYEELEAGLLRVGVNPPAELLAQLQDGERGLLRAIRRVLPSGEGDGQLLLIIDQFEELFTLVPDRETTTRFLEGLIAAVRDPHSPLRVIVTIRADFYDRPLLYPGFSELMQQYTEVVVPLSTDELVRAIERPAVLAGVEVERELVAALVADVQEQAGALPLLQYTLSELFDGRERDQLTLDAYQRLGGIGGALAQRADAVYGELDEAGQAATRALFSRLVTLGDGVEDTRRRVLQAELEALEIAGEQGSVGAGEKGRRGEGENTSSFVTRHSSLVTSIDALGRARLLSFDRDPVTRGPTVEIAHEALLRAWPRLRGWLDEDRAALRLSRLLTVAAAEWEAAGRADGFLLRGSRLDQLALLADGAVALTESERGFLAASLVARTARRAAEEARRQAEIDTVQKLAETERRRADEQSRTARRLRLGAAVLTVALGVAAVLAFLALNFAQSSARSAELAATREGEALANAQLAATREAEALENAQLATSRELASEATNSLAVDPELSILLALEALRTLDTIQTQEALHRAIQASRVISAFDTGATGHINAIMDVSPDGERLATAGESYLTIWEVATGAAIEQLPLPEPAAVHHYVGFDGDGAGLTLVSAAADAQSVAIHSWSPGDTALAGQTLSIGHDAESIIAIDPGRRLLAVSHEEPAVDLWDIATGRLVATLSDKNDFIADMSFDMTGRLLAVAEMSGRTTLWDIAALPAGDPQPVATLENSLPAGDTGALVYAQFVSDTQLALGYLGDVEVWDLSDLNDPRPTRLPQAELTLGYGVNEDGTLLAAATQDGSVQIWSLMSGERSLVLAEHQAPVNVVRFIDGGRRLVSIDRAGHVRVWDTRPLPLGEHESLSVDPGVFDIVLSPDERLIALGNVGGPASLWDAATGERRFLLPGEAGGIYRVDFSPDGRAVAGVGRDNRLHVWDTTTGEELLSVPAHGDGVSGGLFQGTLDVAYSPNGSRLATAGADGLAKVWDAATGELLVTFAEHTDSLHSLAYSPDGRTIATTSDENDASVKVWDAQTGRMVYSLAGHPVRVWGLAFSPDSRYLVTGGARGVIKLWDMATGEEIYTVFDESDHIGSVRFSPDGEWFLTTGEVPMRVRRTADGSEIVALTEPIVWSVDISDDGRYIYGADVNGMLRVLVIEQQDLVTLAHERLTRWWRPEECPIYLHDETCPPTPEKFGGS
jgi:WD40 repeat protein